MFAMLLIIRQQLSLGLCCGVVIIIFPLCNAFFHIEWTQVLLFSACVRLMSCKNLQNKKYDPCWNCSRKVKNGHVIVIAAVLMFPSFCAWSATRMIKDVATAAWCPTRVGYKSSLWHVLFNKCVRQQFMYFFK